MVVTLAKAGVTLDGLAFGRVLTVST